MKIDWNKKYTTIAVYSFIVIAAAIVFYLILAEVDRFNRVITKYISVIYPFLYGFIIAYLINFPLKFFTKLVGKIGFMKKVSKSKIHNVSLVLAYILSGFLVYLFITFILPQLIVSVTGLVKRIPDYVRTTTDFIEDLPNDVSIPPIALDFINKRWAELADFLNETSANLLPTVLTFVRNTAQSFFNLFLGIVISVYLLAEKNRFIGIVKKINYSVFSTGFSEKLLNISRRSNDIFGNFLGGKILDSAIVGVICFIVLSIVRMPYALLVSFIVAVTNVIPFFGPFIGAVPSFLIIFFESPVMAMWFVVIIVILQQIDGNIIGPKILGESLGISSFWILFAVLVSGKIFGFLGMVIGVPLFVLVYSIAKEIMEERLKSKGLPVETDAYADN
ncbi:MAG: AI-2E family transporter [Clostridiales bacterium]|nr:AI-2E family transporter [Clostridiales bacterium]